MLNSRGALYFMYTVVYLEKEANSLMGSFMQLLWAATQVDKKSFYSKFCHCQLEHELGLDCHETESELIEVKGGICPPFEI